MKSAGHQNAVDSYRAYTAAFIYPESMSCDLWDIVKSFYFHSFRSHDMFHSQLRKAEDATAAKLVEENLCVPFYVTCKNVLRMSHRDDAVVSDPLFERLKRDEKPTHVPSAWHWTLSGWEICELMRNDLVMYTPEPRFVLPFNISKEVKGEILDRYFDHEVVVRRTEAQVYSGSNWIDAMRRVGTRVSGGRVGRFVTEKKAQISWSGYCEEVIAFNGKVRLGRV